MTQTHLGSLGRSISNARSSCLHCFLLIPQWVFKTLRAKRVAGVRHWRTAHRVQGQSPAPASACAWSPPLWADSPPPAICHVR